MVEALYKADTKAPELTAEATSREILILPEEVALEDKIRAIHDWIDPKVAASGIREFSQTGDYSLLSPEIRARSRVLKAGIIGLRWQVEEVMAQVCLKAVRERQRQGELSAQRNDWEGQIATKIRQFEGIQVVSDLDNTITDHSKIKKEGPVDPTLLGSALADSLIGSDRRYFPEAFAAIWESLIRDYGNVFYEGGQNAPLRDGMGELLRSLAGNQVRVSILSTNFLPFVAGCLDQIGVRQSVIINAAKEGDITASAKGDMLKWLALTNPKKALLYFGDGATDLPTLEAKEAVSGYFALEGSTFARELQENNIPHLTYRTGDDIRHALAQVTG